MSSGADPLGIPAEDLATPAAGDAGLRRPPAREAAKILADCRDLAIHRLVVSFSALLDRVGDMLMDRANRSLVREETALCLTARRALNADREALMTQFERELREHVDKRMSSEAASKADFSKVDATKLTLIDTAAMDESVLTGNIRRSVENFCHDELATLNRAMGYLLDRPGLETEGNPLAPAVIVEAFAVALRDVQAEDQVKLAILRELNQGPLKEINGIYADVNRHLVSLRVVPTALASAPGARKGAATRRAKPAPRPGKSGDAPGPEMDLMSLFRQLHGGPAAAPAPASAGAPAPPHGPVPLGSGGHLAEEPDRFWMLGVEAPIATGAPQGGGGSRGAGGPPGAGGSPGAGAPPGTPQHRFLGMPSESAGFPPLDPDAGQYFVPLGPLAPTPSGYVPGAPIMATPQLGEGLSRLQTGETGFVLGDGTQVTFSGIPEGKQNVLRELQQSTLGQRVNQLESMTIELVAMLFDFIFETRDLPDGIKALLARLQIPVLKAAMLDGAFFAKRNHPARLLVNALAQAGLGWSASMGHEDPLYRKIHDIVHGVLDRFTDNLAIFEELRDDLDRFLEDEQKAADANIQASAEEIHERDRHDVAPQIARDETERRIETYPVPNFLAAFLRQQWTRVLEQVYLAGGEQSDGWDQSIATVEDLVWSVQPKPTREDRKHLVAMLPSLLKRLSTGMQDFHWARDDRDRFMNNLVEAHAAAVKPQSAQVELPTEAMAEQARAEAAEAQAAGDEASATRAAALATAMARAEPLPPVEEQAPTDDQYLEIAQSLERGMWIEFEGEGGQLAFARLAWVSPLRGTYLFTNRQGQKALSMTAEELAELFRGDRARLVEAEPLLDQAFTSVLETFGGRTAARPN